MKLHTIYGQFFKLDGGAMHGVVPKSIWSKVNIPDENNMCNWATRSLLIEDGNRLILVDSGMGDKQDAKFFGHYHLHGNTLEQNLNKAGFSMDDITDVFLTHLHFDHVGGCIKRDGEKLVPAFKNATFWSHKDHWEWAINPNEREKASFLKENILPLQESGQLKFVDVQDNEEWIPNFKVRYVYGHTEAMMLPQINYNGQTILYCADLIASAGHLPLPWVMSYDMRPLETLSEKKRLLEEALENNWLLYFEHDAINELCSLHRPAKYVIDKERLQLSDL